MAEKIIKKSPEEESIELLRRKVSTINDTLQDIIGVSLSSDTLPKVELLEKPSLFKSILNKARGYSKTAGANKEKSTVTLDSETEDRDVAHEVAHFIHWDIQDEMKQKRKDALTSGEEELSEEQQLIQQSWEEGVAVFIEMEYVADSLLKKHGQKSNSQAVNQRRLTIFTDMYKNGEDYLAVVEKFKQLCIATTRFADAKKTVEKGANVGVSEKVSAIQLAKDIKTMATSKEVLYDIGYSYVLNAVEAFMSHMSMAQAIEIVMSYPPLNVEEMVTVSKYYERVLSTRKFLDKQDQ